MRILIFLFVSLLTHLALFTYIYFSYEVVPNNYEKARFLSVSFKNNNLQVTHNGEKINKVTNLETQSKQIVDTKKNVLDIDTDIKKTPQVKKPELLSSLNSELVMNTQNKVKEIDISNYLGIAEVDRKALPQMNIDQSMLSTENSSGLPITLRLYVNANGKLVKVVPIAVLEQDIAFVESLIKLLYEIKFLPAKREGLDIDSYQDLLLSFNPLPVAGDQGDLN